MLVNNGHKWQKVAAVYVAARFLYGVTRKP
jgi:hypothetical protein